jgi:hypothetical protein
MAPAARAVDALGATIGVTDRSGRGWSARYGYVKGLKQAFSVGLDGAPFTVSVDYVERGGDGACTRTLATSLPLLKRIYAVIDWRRRALAPPVKVRTADRTYRVPIACPIG